MLILNGKKFAANNAEFVASLFDPSGTCVGYYKRTRGGIDLLNVQKEKVGVINRAGVLGSATRQADGKFWYSYATVKEVGPYASYAQQVNECRAAVSA